MRIRWRMGDVGDGGVRWDEGGGGEEDGGRKKGRERGRGVDRGVDVSGRGGDEEKEVGQGGG